MECLTDSTYMLLVGLKNPQSLNTPYNINKKKLYTKQTQSSLEFPEFFRNDQSILNWAEY